MSKRDELIDALSEKMDTAKREMIRDAWHWGLFDYQPEDKCPICDRMNAPSTDPSPHWNDIKPATFAWWRNKP